MQQVQAELIERYQLTLEKDPKSKVFAPLAEAYRKMGWLKQGHEVCLAGLSHNPHFAGGHIALARILIDMKELSRAIPSLKKAIELSPENFLAYSLLGETCLQLKDAKEALRAYKMLLFLDPHHQKAQRAVKKLESLTADEYEADLFAMKPLKQMVDDLSETAVPLEPMNTSPTSTQWRDLDRFLSLTDAYIVRNDIDRAMTTLQDAEKSHGSHPEIVKRFKLINSRNQEPERAETKEPPPVSRAEQAKADKIQRLQAILSHVRMLKEQR